MKEKRGVDLLAQRLEDSGFMFLIGAIGGFLVGSCDLVAAGWIAEVFR